MRRGTVLVEIAGQTGQVTPRRLRCHDFRVSDGECQVAPADAITIKSTIKLNFVTE
jgi:hypothetical protein